MGMLWTSRWGWGLLVVLGDEEDEGDIASGRGLSLIAQARVAPFLSVLRTHGHIPPLLHPQHSITAPDAQIHPGRVHGMSTRRSTGSPATVDRGDSKCVNAQIFSTGSCHYVHLDLSCSCHGRPGLSLHLLSYALPGAETTL